MRPAVGSISRLIIFSVVVLPHPEGPISMTISPSGMAMSSWLTAGVSLPGYVFSTPSRTIMSDFPVPGSGTMTVWSAVSDTDPPGDGQSLDDGEEDLEDGGDHQAQQRAREDLVEGVRRPDA